MYQEPNQYRGDRGIKEIHMNHVLESTRLSKSYPLGKENQIQVLKSVDIAVRPGEFVSVMGPSGSGKSTLLYNLCGMDRMSSGRVVFKDTDLGSLSEKELSRLRLNDMGFVFQQIHLLKNLSLMDNIILPGYLSKTMNRKAVNSRAAGLMEMTGIASLADNDVTQASGGQLQRVGICRALINDPDIVFGDEPTGALDSISTFEVLDLLGSINERGKTVFLVTHDVKVASRSERVILMRDGCLAAEIVLGKYSKPDEDRAVREAKLSQWLRENGC
jgi:putative ABC transport system ATP-binding protein